DERAQRTPHVGGQGLDGELDLREERGRYRLRLRSGAEAREAAEGERLPHPGRPDAPAQDWLRLPVAGISSLDARADAAWLSRTGRVPGARLCSELEWERAARGADAREFPHGDVLGPEDANFDLAHGKQPSAFGPD